MPYQGLALGTTAALAAALLLGVLLWRQSRGRRQTEERFLLLSNAVPQIVFLADRRGQVQFVSARWVEVTGLRRRDAIGEGWKQAVHPDEREALVHRLREMVRQGQVLQIEHRLRAADGSYRWQLLRASPLVERGRAAGSWLGTITDIDALKLAQEQAREQAERLRMASRLTRTGSWRADLASQRLMLSEEAAAVLDLAPDATPLLQDVFVLLEPESLPRARQAFDACIEEGLPFDLEVQIVTATGRQVWVRSVGEAVRGEDGSVVAIQGAQQDITLRMLMMEEIRRLNASLEERIAERTAQLARQEALFRTLAEQAPLPFWTVDARGGVTFLSRAWYELAGGAPPEWHGERWLRLIHPDDRPAVQHNWIRSMATGEPYTGTRRIRARDGTYHTMTYRAVPVRGQEGEVLFWVGVDTDITDLMANEAALRLANEQLESFSYSVSHDLQSPLQRVSSYARLLQQELPPGAPGRAQHYLARIQGNAETMEQLIEGLLALAHVSEVDIIRSAVNLSDMATEILQRLQAEHPQRSVNWRVEPGLSVMGDVRLMRSVMENLLGNAWKFTAHEPAPEIVVSGSSRRGEYAVRDTGCGFDMAYADRLFGTFQRLHSVDEYPGTGIGLATVARAISRQGGRIWAQSAPGQGATFYFTLPPA
ncbi:PAS domain-containing sensor histidine kinase [Ramlibacter alkalitolerans]|uniref:histidine kinase n=1 Tax=Ramlibacter alkalitolerans TaxID=2039631 RepID=A0ABS1JJD9_9BURK|nr:PAS domain-containing protein [Ramlibacter alkalitolerans]MBL0424301.1 PAS domain-containing protein [Ramlibacter alkalitolerans]